MLTDLEIALAHATDDQEIQRTPIHTPTPEATRA